MPTLNIQGKRVKVDDSFLSLSPDEQNAAVDEIAQSLGVTAQAGEPEQPALDRSQLRPALPLPDEHRFARGQEPVVGSILPLRRDENGVSFDSDAGLLGMAKDAFNLPGDVLAGDVDPLSDEGMRRAANLAGIVTPAGPLARMAKPVVQGAKGVGPQISTAPAPGTRRAVEEASTRIGVDLPRAATSDSLMTRQIGKNLQNVPGGGTPLRKASKRAIAQIDDAASRVQNEFGAGSPALAGDRARAEVTGTISDTIASRIADRYDAVDALVDDAVKAPLAKTAEVARTIAARRSEAAMTGKSRAVDMVQEALSRPDGLNYSGVKNLRTAIGELLNGGGPLPEGMSKAELKQVYGALTDDLRSVVGAAGGGKAIGAFEKANTFAAKMSKEREALNRVLGPKNDEGVVSRIISFAGSNSRADQKQLARVRGAVSSDTWNEIASAALANIGRDADGNFSPDRFVTGWGKISEQGKKLLFNSTGKGGHAQALDDIAEVSRRFRQLNEFANPSGTGQAVIGAGVGTSLIYAPLTTLSTIAGARLTASMLAKPKSAKAIANYAKAIEMKANQPKTATLLEKRAGALAVIMADEMGSPQLADTIAQQLRGVVPTAADDQKQQERYDPFAHEYDKGAGDNPAGKPSAPIGPDFWEQWDAGRAI